MDADDLIKLAMLSSMKSEGAARDKTDAPIEELAKLYLNRHPLKVGDRVTLKKGMGAMHRVPKPGQVCVVLEVLERPILPQFEKSFGTPQFMMPHDIRIAVKDSDGDFLCFLIDGGLFEPVKGGNVVNLKRK